MTNRLGVTCWTVVGGMALVVSCGGKDGHGAFVPPSDDGGAGGSVSSRAGAGGKTGTGGRGGSGGSAGSENSVLAPVIEIITPAAAVDPNVDPVLLDDQVTVLCKVTKSTAAGSVAVDASTVKIDMLDADGKSLKSFAGASTEKTDEYSAGFVLTELPSGNISFQCSASDKATPVHSGSATVDTLIDHGPEITIGQPKDGSAHQARGSMNVEFTATPVLLTDRDKQAGITAVTLTVAGAKIPTTSKGQGKYQGTVDFTDKKLFEVTPSGTVPVVITATNNRKSPGKSTQKLTYGIIIDGVGPDVALLDPVENAVVGRASVLKFTVKDTGAGVDRATVAVKINQQDIFFDSDNKQWTWDAAGNYTFNLGGALKDKKSDTQVTVNVLASDLASNASMGNSRTYNLDNQPPIVDLDPPPVYEVRPGTEPGTSQCSDLFDPVGDAAPNDLSTILLRGIFRALVWDQTNYAGQPISYYALTNPDSVRLFVQPDTDKPLLRDTGNDHICDEIWTGSPPNQKNPEDKPLLFFAMAGLKPTGSVAWGHTPPSDPLCQAGPLADALKLCGTPGASDLSVVIRHPVTIVPFEPVIYALQPTAPTQPDCTGIPWELSSAINDESGNSKLGWLCLAARAQDKVGNVGISAPLRVCLSNKENPDPCKDTPPPSCTDSCTPPPHFVQRPVLHN